MSSSTIVDVRGGGLEVLSCTTKEQEDCWDHSVDWVKSLNDQLSYWRSKFPALDHSHILALGERLLTRIPPAIIPRIERLVTIPKVVALETFVLGYEDNEDHMYNQALVLIAAHMDRVHPTVYRNYKLSPAHTRLSSRTMESYKTLEGVPGDFMVFPVQMGGLYRDESVANVRARYIEQEFGLCAYAVGCILLSHGRSLVRGRRLDINCPGSEFASTQGGKLDAALCLTAGIDGNIGLDAYRVNALRPGCGSATGYVF